MFTIYVYTHTKGGKGYQNINYKLWGMRSYVTKFHFSLFPIFPAMNMSYVYSLIIFVFKI